MATYTDLAYEKTPDRLYDLVIDAGNRDLATTDGLDSALFVSLFSDRRAYEDEVADPMRRRGWIGDTVSRVPGDRHGSGLWLYEQSRLAPAGASGLPGETAIGLRVESYSAIEWMEQDGLIRSHAADVVPDTASRLANIVVSIRHMDGSTSQKAFALAQNTRRRALISAG